MRLLEHHGKELLRSESIRVPRGHLTGTVTEAEQVAARLGGPCVVKAQVPIGKRGKSGAVVFTADPGEARAAAHRLLGSRVGPYEVTEILVEERLDIAHELYAAVLNDPATKGPLLLFSTAGGMDVEEVSVTSPELVKRLPIDIIEGVVETDLSTMLTDAGLAAPYRRGVAAVLRSLYAVYRRADADLVEINPLVITGEGEVVALDAKISIDPASVPRQQSVVEGLPDTETAGLTPLERRARELGFHFVELPGDVGILANGAGLTMTTIDVVSHYGGGAANFLEIGGDSYTKATPALELVLSNPRVRSLLVNFCGAFARTDVMADGVVSALEKLQPEVPVFFTIHGTGEEEAVRLVRERLGVEVFDLMDDAVRAAVLAARGEREAV